MSQHKFPKFHILYFEISKQRKLTLNISCACRFNNNYKDSHLKRRKNKTSARLQTTPIRFDFQFFF